MTQKKFRAFTSLTTSQNSHPYDFTDFSGVGSI